VRVSLQLLRIEVRELFVGRAFWAMFVLVAPLVGFSFAQAVSLYAETSSGVARLPALARNLVPLDGIVAPTLGAVYLMNTFLLPFVAIRQMAGDKQRGGLKLLLQAPTGSGRIVIVKLIALMIGWSMALLPAASALVIWRVLGGHLFGPEVAGVLLGHLLYASVVAGTAFLAAAVAESSATAAMLTLAVTLGSWGLEFAAGRQVGVVRDVAAFSLTPALRTLERGLFDSTQVGVLVILAGALFCLAAVWLPTGATRRRRLIGSAAVVVIGAGLVGAVLRVPVYGDLSEDRRNSFSAADEQALRQMDQPLQVIVHLAPGESRLRDLDRGLLSKLRRVVPHLEVEYADTGRSTGTFGAASSDPKYGLTEFNYAGAHVESRSTAASELLPLIHGLAGRQVFVASTVYPGYPLAATIGAWTWWFALVLPLLGVCGWWLNQRPPRVHPRRGPGVWRGLLGQLRTPAGRLATGVALLFLAMQVVPYGRDTSAAATPLEPATTCPTLIDSADFRLRTLGDVRRTLTQMRAHIEEATAALDEAGAGPRVARSQFRQFHTGWEQAELPITRLYPRRCAQLYRSMNQISASLLGPTLDVEAARPAMHSLRDGIAGLARDIERRIGQSSPSALLEQQASETVLPQSLQEPAWDTPRTRDLAVQACYACHSGSISRAWYANVAPLSWFAEQQAQSSLKALNFSRWAEQGPPPSMVDAVERGRMPPRLSMLLTSQSAALSPTEREELVRGLRATLGDRP
jgi:mono/diheme cytochrome c family protein